MIAVPMSINVGTERFVTSTEQTIVSTHAKSSRKLTT